MSNQVIPSNKPIKDISALEGFFDIVGWIGFLTMIPFVFVAFGNPGPLDFLGEQLGPWGSSTSLLAGFYICQGLRTFFGSGTIISPLLVGAVSSFLIMAATLDIGFMAWWAKLLEPLGWFYHQPLSLVLALLTQILAYLLSMAKKLWFPLQILLLCIVPVALIITASEFDINSMLGMQIWQ